LKIVQMSPIAHSTHSRPQDQVLVHIAPNQRPRPTSFIPSSSFPSVNPTKSVQEHNAATTNQPDKDDGPYHGDRDNKTHMLQLYHIDSDPNISSSKHPAYQTTSFKDATMIDMTEYPLDKNEDRNEDKEGDGTEFNNSGNEQAHYGQHHPLKTQQQQLFSDEADSRSHSEGDASFREQSGQQDGSSSLQEQAMDQDERDSVSLHSQQQSDGLCPHEIAAQSESTPRDKVQENQLGEANSGYHRRGSTSSSTTNTNTSIHYSNTKPGSQINKRETIGSLPMPIRIDRSIGAHSNRTSYASSNSTSSIFAHSNSSGSNGSSGSSSSFAAAADTVPLEDVSATAKTGTSASAHSTLTKVAAAVVGATVGKRRPTVTSGFSSSETDSGPMSTRLGPGGGIAGGAGGGAGVLKSFQQPPPSLQRPRQQQPMTIVHGLESKNNLMKDENSRQRLVGLDQERLSQHATFMKVERSVPELREYISQLYKTILGKDEAMEHSQKQIASLRSELDRARSHAEEEKKELVDEMDRTKEQIVTMEENFLLWRTKVHNDQATLQDNLLNERLDKQDRALVLDLRRTLELERQQHQRELKSMRMQSQARLDKLEHDIQAAKMEATMYAEMMHEVVTENDDLRSCVKSASRVMRRHGWTDPNNKNCGDSGGGQNSSVVVSASTSRSNSQGSASGHRSRPRNSDNFGFPSGMESESDDGSDEDMEEIAI
ncbi:hypothetical protein KVV02_004869, partial [Mortierella alpina]